MGAPDDLRRGSTGGGRAGTGEKDCLSVWARGGGRRVVCRRGLCSGVATLPSVRRTGTLEVEERKKGEERRTTAPTYNMFLMGEVIIISAWYPQPLLSISPKQRQATALLNGRSHLLIYASVVDPQVKLVRLTTQSFRQLLDRVANLT